MGWHSKPPGDGIRKRGGVGDLAEVIRTCGWGPHGQISTLIEATPAQTSLAPFPMCPRSQEPAPYNLKAGPHQIPNLPTSWSRTSHPSRTVRNQLLLFTSHSAAAAKSLQSCPTLCDPREGSPPGSPIPGILQARTLEWVAISFSSAWKWKVKVKSESEVAQSHPTLSDPMDCSLPGSLVHGIFQARVLEWGATAFSDKPLNLW